MLAKTAPDGSATRPRIRPPVLWATNKTEVPREHTTIRQTAVQRALDNGMEPPTCSRKDSFKTAACIRGQPCYNPARLEKGKADCQEQKSHPFDSILHSYRGSLGLAHQGMKATNSALYWKIGDVARRVGVSPSVIRSWESLGLAHPRRTESKYRLYSAEHVTLLKRAPFLP